MRARGTKRPQARIHGIPLNRTRDTRHTHAPGTKQALQLSQTPPQQTRNSEHYNATYYCVSNQNATFGFTDVIELFRSCACAVPTFAMRPFLSPVV